MKKKDYQNVIEHGVKFAIPVGLDVADLKMVMENMTAENVLEAISELQKHCAFSRRYDEYGSIDNAAKIVMNRLRNMPKLDVATMCPSFCKIFGTENTKYPILAVLVTENLQTFSRYVVAKDVWAINPTAYNLQDFQIPARDYAYYLSILVSLGLENAAN